MSSGFSEGAGATVNWMKLSHLREAPPRHGGNVCMRGKTSHPSYLQFTPDRGNPGNSPVVHACKTHKSTMSTNCPPGHALACMESNRAKAFGLASSAKAQTFKCFFSACNEHNAHGRLKRSVSTCIGGGGGGNVWTQCVIVCGLVCL